MANPNAPGGPGHPAGQPFTTTNSPARVRWKWELAIRFLLKNPNAKQSEVAKHIGVSPVTLSTWMASPDWQDLHNQIVTGVLSHIDEGLVEDIAEQRLTLKRLLPVALQNLASFALQDSNPQLKFKATQEILDREGNHARVTRVGLPSAEQGGVASHLDNEAATQLLQALAATQGPKAPTIEDPPVTETEQ
jgi:hypothetical protein